MRCTFFVLFFLTAHTTFAQKYKRCDVYEYRGYDSLKKHLARRIEYNKAGKSVLEIEFSGITDTDEVIQYFYRDTFLIKKAESRMGNTILFAYSYDKDNLLYATRVIVYCSPYLPGYGIGSEHGCAQWPDSERTYGWQSVYQCWYRVYDKSKRRILDSNQSCTIDKKGFITCETDDITRYEYSENQREVTEFYTSYKDHGENIDSSRCSIWKRHYFGDSTVSISEKHERYMTDSVDLSENGSSDAIYSVSRKRDSYYKVVVKYTYLPDGQIKQQVTSRRMDNYPEERTVEIYEYFGW